MPNALTVVDVAMTTRQQTFAEFLAATEPRLRQALVATYGAVDGREATVDALSWAWEHFDRVQAMDYPVGYLFRVGQTAVRRFGRRPLPVDPTTEQFSHLPEIAPELLPALGRLPDQQRTIVVLVHAFGWTQAAVAELLDVGPSTVHKQLSRAVDRLRHDLEVRDVQP